MKNCSTCSNNESCGKNIWMRCRLPSLEGYVPASQKVVGAGMTVVTHDGDGKIYADGVFLFEVLIADGDEVARRVNGLIRAAHAVVRPDTAQQPQDDICPFCVGRTGVVCATCEGCLGSGKRSSVH